tara:strand:+ start:421 stop:1203 length:783 start_codon:yes stop_codon:yes gene_type:complete
MTEPTRELTVVDSDSDSSTIVAVDPLEVTSAFRNYLEVQRALDEAMPDSIQHIGNKKFRKKQYWRAIATAFNLRVELTQESREVHEDGEWGYLVTYRATAGNGRTCDGDGACFAREKKGAMCTEHNVRAHAHTRAKNRAIADLCGFGEVSADELSDARDSEPPQRKPKPQSTPRAISSSNVKLLQAAAQDEAERLSERAAIAEISGAPQDDASMQKALKIAAASHCFAPSPITDEYVSAVLSALKTAELNDDGEIVWNAF